jgi:hypothetical protein
MEMATRGKSVSADLLFNVESFAFVTTTYGTIAAPTLTYELVDEQSRSRLPILTQYNLKTAYALRHSPLISHRPLTTPLTPCCQTTEIRTSLPTTHSRCPSLSQHLSRLIGTLRSGALRSSPSSPSSSHLPTAHSPHLPLTDHRDSGIRPRPALLTSVRAILLFLSTLSTPPSLPLLSLSPPSSSPYSLQLPRTLLTLLTPHTPRAPHTPYTPLPPRTPRTPHIPRTPHRPDGYVSASSLLTSSSTSGRTGLVVSKNTTRSNCFAMSQK